MTNAFRLQLSGIFAKLSEAFKWMKSVWTFCPIRRVETLAVPLIPDQEPGAMSLGEVGDQAINAVNWISFDPAQRGDGVMQCFRVESSVGPSG
jgi:hypothetical protein